MPSRLVSLALAFAFALTAAAQTYTPKTIRFEGAPSQDSAQLLALTGWKTGVPITQQEIQAGLQKLADTGSFTDINWHVDNAALVIKLTTSAATSELPVRFVNLAWWNSADLERQLEARVPLYHGQLSQAGTLTTQVEAALTAIAKEKGLDLTFSVAATNDPNTRQRTLAVTIDHPSVVFGELTMPDAKPAFGPTTADFKHGLRNQDFDLSMTAGTIQNDGVSIFRNAGYLDATIDPPVFSAPRSVPSGYAVDATAAVHTGDLYRVTALTLPNPPPDPLSAADLHKTADLKAGDPASPMGLDISAKEIARAYQSRGYLDAEATPSTSIDNVAHTAAYAISIDRGELYHIASVDLSAAPSALQQSLARNSSLAPGAVADFHATSVLFTALRDQKLEHTLRIETHRDRSSHTVVLQLVPSGHRPPA